MLISTEVEVMPNGTNISYLKKMGYKIPMSISAKGNPCYACDVPILVKVEDLSDGSHALVKVQCDVCDKISEISWNSYKRGLEKHSEYYCNECIKKVRIENSLKSRRSKEKSIAQYLINTYGENAIEIYLDCKKNKQLELNPWEISCGSNTKIWANCIHTNYHESYSISASSIKRGRDCPYCAGRKVHPFDSLGKLLEDKGLLNIWSDKNEKSPYTYPRQGRQKAWFKCLKGEHVDYYRSIHNSITYEFRCPECQWSKGETSISIYLNNIKMIYEAQKSYSGLTGLNGGSLSYDFYLPTHSLLIEYQGEQHKTPIDFRNEGMEMAKIRFENQKIHDKRKREYCQLHNINLLEIWYYDFDNIESILNKQLNITPIQEAI